MNEIIRIGPGTRITLHFAVRLEDGTVMDSTFDKAPASFVYGDESLLPGFEKAITGLKAGDKRSVFIEAQKGFGDHNPDNIQHFKSNQFDNAEELVPGTVMSFADAAGGELPGVIAEIKDEWITVDFNHPLAGRNLTFEVEIIAVEPHIPEQAVTLQ